MILPISPFPHFPITPHPTPHTPHPTPHTLHPTPHTPHPSSPSWLKQTTCHHDH
ncbi:MAG: hypothetical protein O9290_09995 [Microcystis sp. LE19-41.2A]|uniref:hypothetical protein n=1 Tax=Microcystis sp. LE19-41.2A TaxID=3016427 RepID=UPI0022C6E578|nr:hypothetical protein [Microcystis sp. LE19-41.2A]MCZ8046956.1 hypothetical protein [Microcystis sp. LE19-41.2A]